MRIEDGDRCPDTKTKCNNPQGQGVVSGRRICPQVSLTSLRDLAPFRQIPTGLFYAPVNQGNRVQNLLADQGKWGKRWGTNALAFLNH
jgi:hypothetical protein